MVWSSIAPVFAEIKSNESVITVARPVEKPTRPSVSKESLDITLGLEHPLLEMIRNAKELPPLDDKFSTESSVLDRDPYFLRSQSWEELQEEELEPGSLETSFDPQSTTIKVAGLSGSSRVLKINEALRTIHVDDNYVFLAAQSSNFFSERASALGDDSLEGLFVVERKTLSNRALSGAAVPLFFLPLPGQGWTGNVLATELPTLKSVAFQNILEGDVVIPVSMDDVETVLYGQSINLQLATLMAMRVGRSQPGSLLENGIFPVPGSTAAFGLYFTGQNLIDPALDFYSFQNIDSQTVPNESHTWLKRSLRDAFGISSVYAQSREATPEELEQLRRSNEALFWRGVRVFSILGFAFGLSVVLKYTVFKEHFKKQRAELEKNPPPIENRGRLVKAWDKYAPAPAKGIARETREYLDVYAHSMTLLYQFVGGTTGNFVEVMFDSMLPQYAASDKTAIRRVLNKTFLFSRNALRDVPVNWDTWVKGTLVIGGMDTALVGLQVYYVVPLMAQGIAEVVPGLEARVDRVYDLNNPLLHSYNQNEVIRNGIAYATAGAASYSGELRSQLELMLGSEVDRELSRQGINVLSEEGKAKREQVLKDRVEVYMKKMGLPGKEGFLFDFYSVYRAQQKIAGYVAEGSEFKVLPAAGSQNEFQFIGEKRPGLVRSALRAAIRDVKERIKSNPNDISAQEALPILKTILSESGHMTFNLAFGLPDQVQKIREIRQSLVVLTYASKFGEDLKLLPSYLFQRFGERGARAASHYYRRAFTALSEGYPELRSVPTETMKQAYGAKALERATTEVQKAHASENLSDFEFQKRYGMEIAMLTELYVHQANYQAEQDAKPYEAENDGVFARLQRKGLTERALAAMKAEGVSFDPVAATPADRLRFYEKYRDQLFSFFRIVPDYESNPGLKASVTEASNHMNNRVMGDHKFQHFLETLSPMGQQTLIAETMALNEVTAYADLTLRGASIHPLDPAQPGFLQQWRKGKSPLKTRLARLYEATLATGEYQLGLKTWVFRNVPFAFDTYTSFQRTLMYLPSYMSTAFLWNKFFWGQTISYPMWFFFVLMLPTIIAPKQFCNRLFEYQRWQPMGSLPMTLLFGFIYSWFTFGGSFPLQLYAEDFVMNVKEIAMVLGAVGVAGAAVVLTKPGKAVQSRIGKWLEPALEATARATSRVTSVCRLALGKLGLTGRGPTGPLGAQNRSQ